MSSPFYAVAETDLQAEHKIFRDLSPPHLLTAVFLKYLLRGGDLPPSDFGTCFTDGPNDGGLDAIASYEQNDVHRIALIQSKRVQEIDKNDILDAASKIARTVADLEGGSAAKYNNRVRGAYERARNTTDNAPLDIMICTTARPSQATRDQVEVALANDDLLKDYNVTVSYGNDVDDAIEHIEQPKPHVDEGTLLRDTAAGVLEYWLAGQDEPKGIITSVSAVSVNRLYSAHHADGLFAQNLRSFIYNKKVDDAISGTIRHSPADFWLKNNGITIACENYRVDGNRIVLYKFSIINGCQTATKIGKSSIDTDFLVQCKIIREHDSLRMAEFAEAANVQKPIQDRDLKSNAPEQIALKRQFEQHEPKVYLGIKRGIQQYTKAQRKIRGVREWQQLDNRAYGQLVLAFHRQKPHIAFSQPGTIFSTQETYKEVFFRRDRDLATEIDVLRLHEAYVQWREHLLNDSGTSELEQVIANQGRFAIIANCAILIKAKRKLVDPSLGHQRQEWQREIVRAELVGPFLGSGGPDLSETTESNLSDLFTLLLELHQSVLGQDNIARLYKSENFYLGPLSQQLMFRWQKNPYARLFADAAQAFT